MDETLLRRLYATPPPEFVAARNEVVKQLRREKRRDDATALAALRRPGWDDWSLNAVAASDSEVVEGFAAAAADVREAQAAAIEGREGPDIRTALRELRERSAELVRKAENALEGAGRQPATGEINARLSQLATNDVAVAQLLAGILGSGDTSPKDLFGVVEPGAPAEPPAKRAPAKRPPAKERAAKAAAPAREEAAPKPDAAAERRARAEQQRRKEALVEANREHAAALKLRHRAEAAVAKAETEAERARDALAAAEERLGAARDELRIEVARADDAAAAVESARADSS